MNVPVLVDFWRPGGPLWRSLGPVLENPKYAGRSARYIDLRLWNSVRRHVRYP